MKKETINFKDFMDGTWREKKVNSKRCKVSRTPMMAMYLPITHNSIATIYGVIALTGAVGIGLSMLETALIRRGNDDIADIVHIGSKVIMRTIVIGSITYFIVRLGVMFL